MLIDYYTFLDEEREVKNVTWGTTSQIDVEILKLEFFFFSLSLYLLLLLLLPLFLFLSYFLSSFIKLDSPFRDNSYSSLASSFLFGRLSFQSLCARVDAIDDNLSAVPTIISFKWQAADAVLEILSLCTLNSNLLSILKQLCWACSNSHSQVEHNAFSFLFSWI